MELKNWRNKKMKRKYFLKNREADVLGLPMYLIIIMIVAVAVIAAVIYMIPKGTRTMNAQVTSNALIAETPTTQGAGQFTLDGQGTASSGYSIWVNVTTNNERRDPIQGATVTLVGSGVASQATTLVNGSVQFTAIKPVLDANINEAHIKITIKAAGFDDFTDEDAITVMRLS